MKALLLIDLQNDFFPGGALGVPDANHLTPLVDTLLNYPFDYIVATKDWHPADHKSFAINHPSKKEGEIVNLNGVDQVLWPAHCIQGTRGAEFAPGWDTTQLDHIFYKGLNPLVDSYSAFFDNLSSGDTGLSAYLQAKGVKELFIVGLALEYCVKYSVIDAIQCGFIPFVILEGCKGINLHPGDTSKALFTMEAAGASIIHFYEVRALLDQPNT